MPRDTAHPRRAVLIVDDDEEYCAFVSDHLSRAGFASRHVATVADAIDVVGREQPSAVLLEGICPRHAATRSATS